MKSNQELREQMRNLLVTDDTFEAFCMDHFPAIQLQFASGMSRLEKESLLLNFVDKSELERCLREGGAFYLGVPRPTSAAPDANSYGAEEMFRQINYVASEFENLLNYNFTTNAWADLLFKVAGKQGREQLDQVEEKLKSLALSFRTAVETCKKACSMCGFWLSVADRELIEEYLKRHNPLIDFLDSNLTLLEGFPKNGRERIIFLINLHGQIQRFRLVTIASDPMRREIEQRLRQYAVSPR